MNQKVIILFPLIVFYIGLAGLQAQTLKDVDDNIYKTVTIGSQVWMAENLKTTKYNDGTAIPLVTDNKGWDAIHNTHQPAFCWYGNDEATNKNIYGALYNWYTVNTNKLCPKDWHVPEDAEWKTLEMHMGMTQKQVDSVGYRGTIEGGKMKETGTIHWNTPNNGATNGIGFNALPSGFRDVAYDTFLGINKSGKWWSSTVNFSNRIWYRQINYNRSRILRNFIWAGNGFSVRCIKD